MTRSDQLRQALAEVDKWRQPVVPPPILDAARFALRVWEGDERLAMRIALVLRGLERNSWKDTAEMVAYRSTARDVLAAITEEEV